MPHASRPLRSRCSLLAIVVVAVLCLPTTTDAARHGDAVPAVTAPITIQFGQEGGNIRPFAVTIDSSGTVSTSGPIRIVGGTPSLSKDTLAGLAVLAEAVGFRSLPGATACAGVLPDIASRYVSIRTGTWHHRSKVHGGCVSGFNQLFAVLMASTRTSF